jgi:putative tricarboxylic transport membrane protein
LNLPLVGLFVNVLRTPKNLLMSCILLLCIVGGFAVNHSAVDLWIMLLAGIAGYVLKKLNFSVAPLVLALVIGPMLEDSLRQSLMLSQGDLSVFYTHPLSRYLFICAGVLVLAPPLFRALKKKLARRRKPGLSS